MSGPLVARTLRVASVVVFLAAACVTACAGTTSSSPSDTPAGTADGGKAATNTAPPAASSTTAAATADSACADFAHAHCARQQTCLPYDFSVAWGDTTTCEERMKVGCAARFSEAGVTNKPDGLAACAKALPGVACDSFSVNVLPAECQSAGTLTDGSACAHDEQCVTGFCKKASFGQCGSCAARVKEGEFCSQAADCALGLVCANASCHKPVTEGAECSRASDCMPGLVCPSGKCTKGQPEGSSCGEEPGLPDPCDRASGVVCNQLLMSCTKAKVVPAGQSCTPYDTCAAGGSCDGIQCTAPLKEGDDCTVTGDSPCLAPSVCELGKCVVPTAAACAGK